MKISIIGGGNMGGAISLALSKRKDYEVMVYERTKEKGEALKKEGNITLLENIGAASSSDIVIIALKPQNLPSFYQEFRALGDKLFISIVAGVDIETLQNNLKSQRVVRFMPNIGAKVSQSVTAIAYPESLKEEDKNASFEVASSFGDAFVLDESLFSTFIGISGSAIAFMFDFMHQIAMSGVRNGITYQDSLNIVSSTMLSAAMLQKKTKTGAIELETMVCSPKGTTIEGVKVLSDEGFASVVQDAVEATIKKSEEMVEESKK